MKELVPDHQGMILVLMFIVGNTLVFPLGGLAGPDIWLAFLTATVLALPIILAMARVRSLMQGSTFFVGFERVLGKWPSRILAFLYGGFAWRLACYVVSDVSNFIQTVALPTTPPVVIATFLALLMLWAAKEGVEVLARFAVMVGKVVLAVLAIIFVLLLSQVDLGEFQPVLYNGFKPVLRGAFQILDFPFLETVVLFWVFDCFGRRVSPYKVFLPGFLAASLVLLIMVSASLAVVGADRYALYYYPVWTAVGRINVSTFLTRLEAIVGVTFAIGSFVKMAVALLAASRCFAYAFGFSDYRFVVTPLAMGVIAGSRWFITTVLEVDQSAVETHSPDKIMFQVVIPLVVWAFAELKAKNGKANGSSQAGGGEEV